MWTSRTARRCALASWYSWSGLERRQGGSEGRCHRRWKGDVLEGRLIRTAMPRTRDGVVISELRG